MRTLSTIQEYSPWRMCYLGSIKPNRYGEDGACRLAWLAVLSVEVLVAL